MTDPQPDRHAPWPPSNGPPSNGPLSNGRLRQMAEHPVGKLLERAAVALIVFLAVWQFNTVQDLRDNFARMRGDQQAVDARLERAERDIQYLWRYNEQADRARSERNQNR